VCIATYLVTAAASDTLSLDGLDWTEEEVADAHTLFLVDAVLKGTIH
jgi:hypothetical protein